MNTSNTLQIRYSTDSKVELGLDEAGRGCFWGPIFAGAVIWPPEEEWTDEHREWTVQIKDSKKMSEKKRNTLAKVIQSISIDYGIGYVEAEEINKNGITWANQEAFRRAKAACYSGLEPELLLVDGILSPEIHDTPYVCIPDGDALYVPIAAASILAKVEHDHWVQQWSSDFKEISDRYDLLNNKGYGTVSHRKGLKTYGSHFQHRTQFVRNWIPQTCDILDV